jgi:5-methylcytosine-specific restriction endonuclease McrA
MTKKEYQDLLKDKRWSKKRKRILARDRHTCTQCESHLYLQVHHLYYIKNNNPWDYPDKALVVLCDDCHEKWHSQYKAEIHVKDIKEYRQIPKKKVKKSIDGYLNHLRALKKKKKNKGFKIHDQLHTARKLY